MGEAPEQSPLQHIKAVFLSYASQDARAAEQIAADLSSAGVEVWLDKSDLRGGDAWDRQIRKSIRDCTLFIPIISANSNSRSEGYFRREWKLAVERTADMAEDVPFLLPVVVDDTKETVARVPDRFCEVQWSRAPAGHAAPEFVDRVKLLLYSGTPAIDVSRPIQKSTFTSVTSAPMPALTARSKLLFWVSTAIAAIVIASLTGGWLLLRAHTEAKKELPSPRRAALPAPAASAFNPPPRSVAVLPFVNMSGDPNQEYFSDGLTEEVLNSLARIDQLQVAARTSSFSFKGRKANIATIARELNVGVVMEGSVRRSGGTVRITAELINATTGYNLWSETFDRDLRDVLKLQSEIANAVANALKVTLLGNLAAKIELGGTHNPDALDSYLRAVRDYYKHADEKSLQGAIATFTVAINQDPDFALAYAGRSVAINFYATEYAAEQAILKTLAKAQRDAQHAIDLAPNLPEGHRALATYYASATVDFKRAMEEYGRAVALAPGSAETLRAYGLFSIRMGHTASGIAALKKAVALDPLNPITLGYLGSGYWDAHQFDASVGAFSEALKLEPNNLRLSVERGLSYYAAGDLTNARTSCEVAPDNWLAQVCLTVTLYRLGRPADAQIIMGKLIRSNGDAVTYQCAEIEAQRGNTSKAIEWLEKTVRARDGAALKLLLTDPLLDPLRAEPRFQAIQRELFP